MMYSSYSALQRRQLTKQVYTDTQSSYLLVYAPGRHLALENSLANQLHRKFRLVARLEGELGVRPAVVATGGDAALIARGVERIDHVDPDITLNGLRIAAGLNL